MSEETVENTATEEVAESETAPVESESNPIFDALFKIQEEDTEEQAAPEEEIFERPSSLHETLYEMEREASSGEEPSADEEKPAEEASPPASSPKLKPKLKVKGRVVDPDFKPSTPAPPRRQIPSTPDDPFVSELNEDEKDRYNLAKWASQNVRGQESLAGDYLNFFKGHKDYINKRLEEDPDLELKDDEGYNTFVEAARPKINIKDLEREKWTQAAEQRAMKRMQPEIQRLSREQTRIQNAPVAKENIGRARKLMVEAIPEGMRKELYENAEDYAKRNPFEVNIVNTAVANGLALTQAFYDILYEIVDYNEQDSVHRALSEFINSEQESFIQSGKTKRNGKLFVRRERFPHVPDEEKGKYYTFTDDDIARLLAMRTKSTMEGQLDQMRNQFASAGYTRSGVPAPSAPAATPEPSKDQQNATRPIQPTQMAGAALPTPQKSATPKNTVLSLLDM